jgi:hypothetical protein
VPRQRHPSTAGSKQFAVSAGHRLITERFNLLCGNTGAAQCLDHVIDDTKVVAGRIDRDTDVGVLGAHSLRAHRVLAHHGGCDAFGQLARLREGQPGAS